MWLDNGYDVSRKQGRSASSRDWTPRSSFAISSSTSTTPDLLHWTGLLMMPCYRSCDIDRTWRVDRSHEQARAGNEFSLLGTLGGKGINGCQLNTDQS